MTTGSFCQPLFKFFSHSPAATGRGRLKAMPQSSEQGRIEMEDYMDDDGYGNRVKTSKKRPPHYA